MMRAPTRIALTLLLAFGASQSKAQGADGTQRSAGAPSPEVARAIAATVARFDSALAGRDRAKLEPIVADPFTWVHGSDGRVESREVWLAAAARGMALTGQRSIRTEHGTTLSAHGSPLPHTVTRISLVKLRDSAGTRESWLRQSQMFVRGVNGTWQLAWGQGTLMYEGPPLDTTLHARYAGTYVISPGRVLVLAWRDGMLTATLPSGATAPIFLGSPTEEVTRTVGSGRLRFALGPDGRPITAALVRRDEELWRATRQP